jgi:hypothetical protein
MKALISPFEDAMDPTDRERRTVIGQRVVQVVEDDKIFDVGTGMFWTDCPSDCVADRCYYDTQSKTVKNFPLLPAAQ